MCVSARVCPHHDIATTFRHSYEVKKHDGRLSVEELTKYKQALALIQSLEEKLPRNTTSGDNKSSIKEVGGLCVYMCGCGVRGRGWVRGCKLWIGYPIHTRDKSGIKPDEVKAIVVVKQKVMGMCVHVCVRARARARARVCARARGCVYYLQPP